ncbi:MAG: hypothetical protein ACI4JK_10955 [Oscillospiraceae bacterium]
MKKSRTAILAAAASIMLSGCTLGGTAENLLSPPILHEEQDEIYSALLKCTGENISLCYPRSGTRRSAFVIEDLDGSGEDEAIVFYSVRDQLRVNILDKDENEKWKSVCDFAGIGTSVDRIQTASIGPTARTSIIVGYGESGSDKLLKVYSYAKGTVSENYSDSYSSFFTYDLNGDGNDGLCIIRSNNENIGRKADFSIVTDTGKSVEKQDTIALNDRASEFVGVVLGNVGENTPAVFIDELSGGQLSTEIIYSVADTLRNPLYLDERQMINDTMRSKGYYSADIDLDGITEIPTLSYFPGYDQDDRDAFISTNWNVYSNFTINKKYSSYYDTEKGFCFVLPARWDGLVTIKRDEHNGDIVFYKYFADLMNSNVELLRLSAVSADYYDEKTENGYVWLKSRDNIHYFCKLPEASDEPLIPTAAEVVNNFYIMSRN